MPQFQGSQFTPLYQEKWRREEEQKQPFGKALAGGFAQGVVGGIQQAQQRKQSQYELALKLTYEKLKDSEAYYADSGEPLSFKDQMQFANEIASGRFDTSKSTFGNKRIAFRPISENNQTTMVSVNEDNIEMLKKTNPARFASVDLGATIPVPNKEVKSMNEMWSREKLKEKEFEAKRSSQAQKQKDALARIEKRYSLINEKVYAGRPLNERDKLSYYEKLVKVENSFKKDDGTVISGLMDEYLKAQSTRINWERKYPVVLGIRPGQQKQQAPVPQTPAPQQQAPSRPSIFGSMLPSAGASERPQRKPKFEIVE